MERPVSKNETLGDQYRGLKQKALQEIRDSGGEFPVDAEKLFDNHFAEVDYRLSAKGNWATEDAIRFLEFSGISTPTANKLLWLWLKLHRDSGEALHRIH